MNGIVILSIVIASISFLGFLANIIRDYIRPRFYRANIEYAADHYFITNNLASHDAVLVNRGKGVAHNIKYYIELKPSYKIIESKSNPKGDSETGGKGKRVVEFCWNSLAPDNFISVRVISSANKKKPDSVFPMETKLSDNKRILSRMYTP